jgi:hypothetical protein
LICSNLFDFETPHPALNGETRLRLRLRAAARLRRLSIFNFGMLYSSDIVTKRGKINRWGISKSNCLTMRQC